MLFLEGFSPGAAATSPPPELELLRASVLVVSIEELSGTLLLAPSSPFESSPCLFELSISVYSAITILNWYENVNAYATGGVVIFPLMLQNSAKGYDPMVRGKQILAALLLSVMSALAYVPTVYAAQSSSTNYGVSEVNF